MMQVTHSTIYIGGQLYRCLVLTFDHPEVTRERRDRWRKHVGRCWRGKARRRALRLLGRYAAC